MGERSDFRRPDFLFSIYIGSKNGYFIHLGYICPILPWYLHM